MLSTVCSGEIARNLLRYKENMCVDSMHHRTDTRTFISSELLYMRIKLYCIFNLSPSTTLGK